jgi:hypothetical protein
MDTLYTFPYKNPKNCNLHESKEICTSLKITVPIESRIRKFDLILLINDYWWHMPLAYKRIQINHQNTFYYAASINNIYKSFIKTYDDSLREVYKLTHIRKSYTIRYCKSNKKWTIETILKIKPEYLDRLRNIMLYLELQHIFMNFYNQNLMINDIFIYFINFYRQYLSIPIESYIII